MSVMADIQRQQAEVQRMQARHLAQHEQMIEEGMRLHQQRAREQNENMRLHEQRAREQDESMRLHEQRAREQDESMRLHEQRMAHVDMRLSEIADKLDGLIGFQG